MKKATEFDVKGKEKVQNQIINSGIKVKDKVVPFFQ
jgi:hypothetical protein